MSHIVEIKSQVRDPAAVQAACRRLGLAEPVQGTTALFSGSATGLAIRLPNWRYPVVFNVTTGEAKFDDYGGAWKGQT